MAPLDLRMVSQRFAEVDGQIVTVRSGTIVSDLSANVDVLVTLDNDPSGAVVSAQGLNYPLASGTRVQLLAYPARGLVVLGALTDLDTGWVQVLGGVGFENSWVNFDAGWTTAAYRKVGSQVFIRGLVKNGAAAGTIFTLPAAYRPLANVMYAGVAVSRTATGSVTAFTGQSDSDGTNASPNVTGASSAPPPAHTHSLSAHDHTHSHAIDHTHSGTVTTSITEIGTRIDVMSTGTVNQVSGTANGYVGLWGSFWID